MTRPQNHSQERVKKEGVRERERERARGSERGGGEARVGVERASEGKADGGGGERERDSRNVAFTPSSRALRNDIFEPMKKRRLQ
jgi:hypothetical protein